MVVLFLLTLGPYSQDRSHHGPLLVSCTFESGESNFGYLFMLVHAGRFSQARQEVHRVSEWV